MRLVAAAAHLVAIATTTGYEISNRHPTTEYSTWMATSIISRGQGVFTGSGDASELLQAGFTQKAFRQWIDQHPHHASAPLISSHIKRSVDSVIPAILSTAADKSWPLDRLSNGNNLIKEYEGSGNETYRKAFEALRDSIDLQPRNTEGGLWYYTYPNWSYLDGMASFAPFYTLYTTLYDDENTTAVPRDLETQLQLLWTHCRHNTSGLLVHGYDDSRTAVWADNVTGASPHVWGRSLGWYTMALVDTLELLPKTPKYAAALYSIRLLFRDLAASLLRAVDSRSGAWWQILDQPGREGNYIESSGSAMFIYSLLKGTRLGFLPEMDVNRVARRAYEYIVDRFVFENENGTLGYNGTVAVCSLNSTATYEYYVNRPILLDSVLGSAAFVLASLEYEALRK